MNRRGFLAVAGGAAVASRWSYAASEVDEAVSVLKGADFIAIGERHDNPGHHRLQADLVAALNPKGLAFEMIPQAKEETVNRLRADEVSRKALGEALEWEESGWPDWSLYAPILEAVPAAYVAGGGLAKVDLGKVYSKGAVGIGDDLAKRYRLAEPLPEAQRTDMLNEQFAAHCELVERDKLGAMVEVQRAWDASYAEAWRRAGISGDGLSVLICGNAHARLDTGAPAYLAYALPDAKIASIGMLEEDEEAAEGQFTVTLSAAAPERKDPCEQMREALQKKG